MLRTTTLALLASAALLATTACSMEKVDHAGSMPAASGAAAELLQAQELHTMFEAEKRNAMFSELPAQF